MRYFRLAHGIVPVALYQGMILFPSSSTSSLARALTLARPRPQQRRSSSTSSITSRCWFSSTSSSRTPTGSSGSISLSSSAEDNAAATAAVPANNIDAPSNSNMNSSLEKPFYRLYYNDVYQVHLPPKHRFPMSKYSQVRGLVQQWIADLPLEEQNKVNCEFRVSPLATEEELATTHSRDYIQRFLIGDQTEREQRNVGFPWSLQGVDRALSSVGGTLAAACDVCEQTIKQRNNNNTQSQQSHSLPAPWAAHVAGGTHHAFWDRGEGFSVFSDIAVAANVILRRYPKLIQKILIIDLDVHQGNGNAVLFQDRPEVATFSMHCTANYFSKKEHSDLDIELPPGCTDPTYLISLKHWLKVIEQESDGSFDLIFFQAGVDVLEEDRLGRMALSQRGVQRRNEFVYDFAHRLNIPLVICMGGGYPRTDDWNPILQAHANVYFQAHCFRATNDVVLTD